MSSNLNHEGHTMTTTPKPEKLSDLLNFDPVTGEPLDALGETLPEPTNRPLYRSWEDLEPWEQNEADRSAYQSECIEAAQAEW